jgi:DNA-binding response OmpR family regulator
MVELTTKVLLVEDNPGDARLMKEMLLEVGATNIDLETVETLKDGIDLLADEDFDLVLLDLTLPDSSGFDTFLTMNEHAPSVAIIVMTGLDDETIALRAMREGAQDYLVKGKTDGTLLVKAIRYGIERQKAEEQIKQSLEEKIWLLREIHHRVKNNLQIVSSLLQLQSRFIQDEKVLDIFRESQNRVRSMALVHERLYRSDDLESIDFSDYTRTLINQLRRTYASTSKNNRDGLQRVQVRFP